MSTTGPRRRIRRGSISSWTSAGSVQVGIPSCTRPLTSHIALSVPADDPYATSNASRRPSSSSASAIPPETAPRMPPPSTTRAIRASGGGSRRASTTGWDKAGRLRSACARPPPLHRVRRSKRADRNRPNGAPDRLRTGSTSVGAEGVRGSLSHKGTAGNDRRRDPGGHGSGASVRTEAGGPPLPGIDGQARPGAGGPHSRPLRRRRRARVGGRGRRRRAARQHRSAAGLRRDEDQGAGSGAGEAVRNREGGRAGAVAPDTRGRRFRAGAGGLPGEEAGAQG